ncbi:MAG: hypothetical protein Q4D31_06380 [Eubacteriales bacterium]|nr:hypothetical protein [Eubacteriales bacterium]
MTELLLDLFDVLLCGAAHGARAPRVPKPLGIALAVLVSAVLLCAGGVMLFCAVCLHEGLAVRLLCLAIALLCWGYWAYFAAAVRKRMRR